MTPLSRDEKELVFDCCLGLTETEHGIQTTTLPIHKEKAAELHTRIRSALRPLESVRPPTCPAGLIESTVQRLLGAAQGICSAARPDMADFSLHRSGQLAPSASAAMMRELSSKDIDGSIRF